MPVKKATTKKESEVPVPARDVREAGRNVLKKITAEEKKKRQKQYQNEIKDVLGSVRTIVYLVSIITFYISAEICRKTWARKIGRGTC